MYSLLILVLLIRGSEVTKSIFFLVYYLAVFVFLLGFDEFVFKERKNKFPAIFPDREHIYMLF